MASTGIMGDSGDFRTNQQSGSNPVGNTAKRGSGKLAEIIANSAAQRRQMSNQQFQAAAEILRTKTEGKARVKVVKAEGKQTRKNATKFGELKAAGDIAAKKSGVARTEVDFGTGKTMTQFKEPRTRAPRTAVPAAAPATSAATRAPSKYNARNPHPKNPAPAGTKEHKQYNTGTATQRAALTRKFKQGPK